MLTYGQAFYQLKDQLQPLYDANEAVAIAHLFMEYVTGMGKIERLDKKDEVLTEKQQLIFDSKSKELLKGKPIQYITATAWFMGREFMVNDNVLIPRPETEELVQWVVDEVKSQKSKVKSDEREACQILDVGTGSGCIPISLKLGLPGAIVASCDISGEALGVAQFNAGELKADVQFMKVDFLDAEHRNKLGRYDVIVSNPPYIPAEEKARLHRNVREYEPAIALFVPDNDALVFYRALAEFGKGHLNRGGCIYCEVDAGHAAECEALFETEGYDEVEVRKDMHGNWRMVRAVIS